MVPPVCIDVNGDDVKDILVMTYDGSLVLYDGETLHKMWQSEFPGMESYRYSSTCLERPPHWA